MSGNTSSGSVNTTAVPKEVLAFYYPWYGNPATDNGAGWRHWVPNSTGTQSGAVAYQPSDGLYSSDDSTEVAHQLAEAKAAGITGFISSWWGPGDYTDKNLSVELQQAQQNGMKITAIIEPGAVSGTGDALVSSIESDLSYLVKNYGSNPAWLSVDGKPVAFLYADVTKSLTAAQVNSIISYAQTLSPQGVEIMGEYGYPYNANWNGIFAYTNAGDINGMSLSQASSWYNAIQSNRLPQERAAGQITTATVIPGFDNSASTGGVNDTVVSRDSGTLYSTEWQDAINSNPDWVLVSTWNEYHEGSSIEPTTAYGTQYLQVTAQYAKQFMGSAYTGTSTGLIQNTASAATTTTPAPTTTTPAAIAPTTPPASSITTPGSTSTTAAHTVTTTTIDNNPPAAGPSTIDIAVSGDSWQGDAEYMVKVDGTFVAGGVAQVQHVTGAGEVYQLVGNWSASDTHDVQISFLNDAFGGSASTDRNLYVDSIAMNGKTYASTSAALMSDGSHDFIIGGNSAVTHGATDTISLNLSEDAWQGNAQFQISVDGKTLDVPQEVTALHSAGTSQDFVFSGNFGPGTHDIGISYVNDAYGGTPQTDRNLYINSLSFDGKSQAGLEMYGNGSVHFTVSSY